jgi:DNA (cytosine-5)-methyltransferase 1
MTWKVLDLFCGAGGAAVGLKRAWPDAEIIGVDIKPQKHYPFTFVLGDAMRPPFDLREFDFIWASPPCQAYSECTPTTNRANHPDLIAPIRRMLINAGIPFAIENVEMARSRLINPIMLCGSMFGLKIWRHRYFECVPDRLVLTHPCYHNERPILVSGQGQKWVDGIRLPKPRVSEKLTAMEIDWMTGDEVTEAIPPAYSEFIARQIRTLPAQQMELLDK